VAEKTRKGLGEFMLSVRGRRGGEEGGREGRDGGNEMSWT